MSDENEVVRFILAHEDPGLRGNITYDEGGATRYGIAQKFHPGIDIAHITVDQATAIYKNEYIFPNRVQTINDQVVANIVGDCLVNPGPEEGAKIVQRAVNRLTGNALIVDGKMGYETLLHINTVPAGELIPLLRAFRALFYFSDVQRDSQKLPFLLGWLVRACS
jgi:lysozyme family protein